MSPVLRGSAIPRAVLAQTPPLGWNSRDCFGLGVAEWAVRENADFMASRLVSYGWEYVVVDGEWYNATAGREGYDDRAALDMDPNARLLPSANRFPSAAMGRGFKSLADYVHRVGLKFGIRIMRGIPRQAVNINTPILGSSARAQDVADTNDTCSWNANMYGVNPDKPGAQAYYDSIARLYADWGVDFLKADDMTNPYHSGEIALLRRALDRFAPNIVLSLAPGPAPMQQAGDLAQAAQMWNIAQDPTDRWDDIAAMFQLCGTWSAYGGPGCWPYAGSLPFGKLDMKSERLAGGGRRSRLATGEQAAALTLWAIFGSPLFFGGHLPQSPPETVALLTNEGALRLLSMARGGRPISRNGDVVTWAAAQPDGVRYAALFNLSHSGTAATVPLTQFNIPLPCDIRDVWARQALPPTFDSLKLAVPAHGVRLIQLSPKL